MPPLPSPAHKGLATTLALEHEQQPLRRSRQAGRHPDLCIALAICLTHTINSAVRVGKQPYSPRNQCGPDPEHESFKDPLVHDHSGIHAITPYSLHACRALSPAEFCHESAPDQMVTEAVKLRGDDLVALMNSLDESLSKQARAAWDVQRFAAGNFMENVQINQFLVITEQPEMVNMVAEQARANVAFVNPKKFHNKSTPTSCHDELEQTPEVAQTPEHELRDGSVRSAGLS